ncbi:MAG: putative bifunctional diguanylate cyclase/phosphodiesterase [Acidimicrobiia bacterium]
MTNAATMFESVVEAVSDGVVVLRADHTLVVVNAAARAVLPLRPGQRVCAATLQRFLPGRAVIRNEAVALGATAGEHGAGEHGADDGRLIVFRTDDVPGPAASPRPAATAVERTNATATSCSRARCDAAERSATERDADVRFRLAFEGSPIGMTVVAADGSLLEANEAAAAMTGYSRDELAAMHCIDLTSPEDWPHLARAFERIFEEGEIRVSFEKRYVRADGEIRWDQVHASVIEWRDGRPWRLLVQSLDITERRAVDTRLHYLADHDPLTGLLNRRSFERALRQHQAAVAELGPAGALLVLDLDHFKYVNDSLGHHAGDQLIRSIAQILSATMTDRATVARLGGDEFAVLLPTGGAMEAKVVAETLIDAIRETTVQLRGGSRRRVTTSVGVALFDGSTQSADDMLVSADLAMYDAKEEGRNRWALSSTSDLSDRRRTRSRISWVERIERALEGDDFELYAQPIVDLRNGAVAQYELLLRMRESDGSLTLPADFLAVAERLDLIQGIDRWVTTRAIDLLADHQRSGRNLSLEINLSGRSLNDVGLLDLISSRISTSGVDPHGLIFEVTETAAVSDIAAARHLAQALSDLGCRFALDDFGAGFGSFYYLKYLPFDFLKIDGEFVSHCTSNEMDKTIIRALVNVARQLGKQTVAEFTRDAATLRFLRKEGVDHAQGYHVGRPVPLAQALGPSALPFVDLRDGDPERGRPLPADGTGGARPRTRR